MDIEMRPVADLKPYEGNPRVNDGAVEAVARSIADYGWRQPIVVDGDGVVVVGHTRLLAAQKLGIDKVPVHVADLTPEQAKAYRLADNRTGEIAEWDLDLLRVELDQLAELDFDLGSIGFDDGTVARMLGEEPLVEGETEPDEVPEPPAEPVTKRGDLWILGDHRLLCGDSTDAADVDRLMDGQKAGLIATDPPYLVDYTGERVNDSGKDWSDTYREVDIADADRFFLDVFTHVKRVAAPNAAIYCWHAHKRQPELALAWRQLGILDHQQIIWVKPTTVFGSVFYHFRHEPCMMGWVQGSKPPHDGSHELNSVWDVDWEGKSRVVGNEHPTQKPVELFVIPMRKHTSPGAVCYEPFSGSGSQLIAAEQTGRRCFAMELEPTYVDVAVRRWERFTGQEAERS